jgi:hypothetical protein
VRGDLSTLRLLENYLRHISSDPRRERLFLAWLSFVVTFATVRAITHAIRANVGPFHDVTRGTAHIHHLVWGILLLLLVGCLWLFQVGIGVSATHAWSSRLTSLLFGVGAALTLDEFALWLLFQDVYWEPQGRDSIDAVIVFSGLLAVGWTGAPFFQGVWRDLRRFDRRMSH